MTLPDTLLNLQKWLQENNTDVALISNPVTIAYFTGYEMEPEERIFMLLVFKDAAPFVFVPALNVEEAKASEWDGEVYGYLDSENPWAIIKDQVLKHTKDCQTWGIENDHLPVEKYLAMQKEFSDASFKTNLTPVIQHMRLYKTPLEIEKLQAAGSEADFAFQVGFNEIKTGVTERYIAGQIDYQLKLQKGVMNMSFETIVQAGKNAANPHLGPTMNKIEPNQLVLFDLGTMHDGYASDASRTVCYGKPDDKMREIYEVNREAQQAAIEAAKPGMTASELDGVARKIITDAGYGEYFIHRLGHGIGKVVHEYPSIVNGNDLVLEPGMCFSIEPGIYIPGFAGVRIEDCGVLTDQGFKPFTKTDKSLKIIPAD